jgi:hypothetical protein
MKISEIKIGKTVAYSSGHYVFKTKHDANAWIEKVSRICGEPGIMTHIRPEHTIVSEPKVEAEPILRIICLD